MVRVYAGLRAFTRTRCAGRGGRCPGGTWGHDHRPAGPATPWGTRRGRGSESPCPFTDIDPPRDFSANLRGRVDLRQRGHRLCSLTLTPPPRGAALLPKSKRLRRV